jgi:hypothetical protein
MADTDTLLPGYTPSPGGETPPPGGMRGEVADNPDLERPEFRREVIVERSRVITVEEASGTAFAEASGAIERSSPPPAVEPSSTDAPGIETAPTSATMWQRPLLLGAALVGGALLAMLTGSSRRRNAVPDSVDPQELRPTQDG